MNILAVVVILRYAGDIPTILHLVEKIQFFGSVQNLAACRLHSFLHALAAVNRLFHGGVQIGLHTAVLGVEFLELYFVLVGHFVYVRAYVHEKALGFIVPLRQVRAEHTINSCEYAVKYARERISKALQAAEEIPVKEIQQPLECRKKRIAKKPAHKLQRTAENCFQKRGKLAQIFLQRLNALSDYINQQLNKRLGGSQNVPNRLDKCFHNIKNRVEQFQNHIKQRH